jgi:hypothetical protein
VRARGTGASGGMLRTTQRGPGRVEGRCECAEQPSCGISEHVRAVLRKVDQVACAPAEPRRRLTTHRRLTASAKLGLLNRQAQIADVDNREAATLRSRERKKRTGNAGDAEVAGRQGQQGSGTGSTQMAKATEKAMMKNDGKAPATTTSHKNRLGQRERRRLAVRTLWAATRTASMSLILWVSPPSLSTGASAPLATAQSDGYVLTERAVRHVGHGRLQVLEHGAHAHHVLQANEGLAPAVVSSSKARNLPAVLTRPVTGGAEHAASREPLHPSWEAKKKQRVAITAALGARAQNKKVFDEGGDATLAMPVIDGSAHAAQRIGAPVSLRKERRERPPVNSDGLHPSWLAKQKQKQLVADMLRSPKGSRMVFD